MSNKNVKNIGIITLNFNNNIGGVLQNFALQEFLKKNGYNTTTLQGRPYKNSLTFIKEYINMKVIPEDKFSDLEDDYDAYIVGSDQVWKKEYIIKRNWQSWDDIFLKFAENWDVKKVGYSISWGKDEFDLLYNYPEVEKYIKLFDNISCREISGTDKIKEITNRDILTTCDPALLLSKEDYLKLCEEKPVKKGFFKYMLDYTDDKKNFVKSLKHNEIAVNDKFIKDFLAAYRDADFIITDSYHGCLFSIIFNKPFLCFYNKERGGARFDTLISLFGIEERLVIDKVSKEKLNLLKVKPDIDYSDLVEKSKQYLLEALKNG